MQRSASTVSPAALAEALRLTPVQARAVYAAARRVAAADGALPERSAELIAVLGHALGTDPTTDEPDARVAFPESAQRRALVDALIVVASIEGEVTLNRQRSVEALAEELDVHSPWVALIPELRRRRVFPVKLGLVRRSPDARRLFARTWAEEKVLGLWRAFLFVAGLYRDRALAARYRSLAELPRGSFGRQVADHFHARGLAFPGERGGVPERMLHHDLMHVVNGYDTDPAGECEIAGFYAGSTATDGFTFIVTALATFHLGMSVSPSVVTPARGAFDPERVLAAYLRGRRLRVDVMGRWDYWALMPQPLGRVQEVLGIGPL